jgi:hypothetical protein
MTAQPASLNQLFAVLVSKLQPLKLRASLRFEQAFAITLPS